MAATTEFPQAHQVIQRLYSKVEQALVKRNQSKAVSKFEKLGIDPEDTEAFQIFSELHPKFNHEAFKFVPTKSSGVYYLKGADSQTVAVFKIGRKRASMELMARTLACKLGLQKHMVAGMFFGMFEPPLHPDDDTIEELWNGNHKIFVDVDEELYHADNGGFEKTARAVVGIVQPFLFDLPEETLLDFTKKTIFALALGLRDGKAENMEEATFIDVEDCMPIRIDPPTWDGEQVNKYPSALELRFLDSDPNAKKSLPLENVGHLATLVQNWNISTIIQELGKLKIRYEDKVAEEKKVGYKGMDEGGCPVEIVKPDYPHPINGALNHLSGANPEKLLLLPTQLDACNTRLQRIHDFILDCAFHQQCFTPQELAHAVDPWGKIYSDKVIQSPKLPQKLGSMVFSTGLNTVTGRRSPDEVDFAIPFKEANLHPAAVVLRKSQGVPEETPTLPPMQSPQEDSGSTLGQTASDRRVDLASL